MLYDRPFYYAITHIVIGFIAAWYPLVGVIGVAYQLFQLFFNIRTFPFELRYELGNSLQHTSLKLLEMLVGYSVGVVVRRSI